MTPISLIVDAAVGFVAGAGLLAVVPSADFSIGDLAGAGGVGAVLVTLLVLTKDRKEEREKQAEERQKHADLLAKEREQAALERQHGMDRIGEITSTFSKTVLDIVAKKAS